MYFVVGVIDHAVDRAAEHRPAHDAVTQGNAARCSREVDLHAGERHLPVALRLIAVGDRALKLRFVVHGEIAHGHGAELDRIAG